MRTLFLLLCLLPAGLFAQVHTRNVQIEYSGPAHRIGAFYEARFRAYPQLGYRVGLAYQPRSAEFVNEEFKTQGWLVPAEINLLLGRRHAFESAAGVLVGYFSEIGETGLVGGNSERYEKADRMGLALRFAAGYRYQMANGLLLRMGLGTTIGGSGRYAIHDNLEPLLYAGVGYAF